jgi:hypothetical protein
VLTPPAIRRLEDPLDTGPQPVIPRAAPNTGQVLAPQVRPGHGLDGPEITSSWPAQPQVEEAESFEEFWAEDDNDAEYEGLFPGEDPDFDARRKARTRTKAEGRRTGRRRGRSNDHRLWLALLGVLIVAAAAIFGILKFEFPSHAGPTHRMTTPAGIGSYMRTVDMEKETKLNKLRAEVIKMSSGEASNVVSAIYESGNSAAGNTEQIVMFIGGHLANAAPASSIGRSARDLGLRRHVRLVRQRQLRRDRLAHHERQRAGRRDAHHAPVAGDRDQEVRILAPGLGPPAHRQARHGQHDGHAQRDQARHLSGEDRRAERDRRGFGDRRGVPLGRLRRRGGRAEARAGRRADGREQVSRAAGLHEHARLAVQRRDGPERHQGNVRRGARRGGG